MIRSFEKSNTQAIKYRPSIESVLLALIAVLIVQTFRAGSHPFPWWVRIETCIQLAIPLLILVGFVRYDKSGRTLQRSTSLKYVLQFGAFLYAGLPILIQLISRSLFNVGDANEIVALLVLQNAAWYMSILSSFWNFGRVGFLLAAALVLFVSFTSSNWQILGLALFYSLIAMWWLMGHYWSRVETKLLDGKSKALRARWSFLVASAVIVGVAGLIASSSGPIMKTISVAGFMPTSGGNQWSDDYAIAGMGDGNMLAAGENATTTGAVNSNQFIEDNRTSIYDAINDLFDEPIEFKKKKRNRAVTLQDETTHIHNVKRSEQSGKTFRVVREPGENRRKRNYEDIVSNAQFFVEGSVPVRFAVNTFNHFDGWDWSRREVESNERLNCGIQVIERNSQPWFEIQSQHRSYLPSSRQHRLKIMRLKSSALPSPPFLQRWHIFKVGNRSMFDWGESDIIEFDGELPGQTMIDVVGSVPNYHELRSSNNFTNSFTAESNGILDWLDKKIGIVHHTHMSQGSKFQTERDSKSQFVQVANESTKQRLREIADEWTEGIEPGWNQVEAIVSRLRNEFTVDASQVASPDCDNAVDHFFDAKAGPGYLFATSAAQLLRAAGYKTRLTMGYLVQKDDYVHVAGQSIVTNENLHAWPEICLDNCHWIPLEPTPGYPIPYSTETLLQLAKRKIAEAFFWIVGHPITSGTVLLLLILIIRFRAKLFAGMWWLHWYVVFHLFSHRRLKVTRQLLDARFRAAGYPRPQSETIVNWFSQVDGNAHRSFYRYWLAANFGSVPLDPRSPTVVDACKELLQELPLASIASFVHQNSNQKSES